MSDSIASVTDRRCQATSKSGKPCRARPLQDQLYCSLHSDPERAREIAKKPRKGGLQPELNPPVNPPLQTASQIRDFLAQLMADVRKRVVDAKTAATLGTLATAQLRAVSAAELEHRVQALEQKVGDNAPAEVQVGFPTAEEWEKLFAPSGDQRATILSESSSAHCSDSESDSSQPRAMTDH